MSNETTPVTGSTSSTASVAAVTPPSITRNEVSKVLSEDSFGKNSKAKGQKFFTPKFTAAGIVDDSKWLGLDYIINVLNRTTRRVFADLYLDNIDDKTGKFDEVNWLKEATDFTEGVATLSDLQEEVDELTGKMQDIVTNETSGFGQTNEDGTYTELALQKEEEVKKLGLTLKPLRAQIAKIRATYKERLEKKEATKKANEAAKLLAAQQAGTQAQATA